MATYYVNVPPCEAVDLYATTGVPVGTRIAVQNIGMHSVQLYDQVYTSAPDQPHVVVMRGEWVGNTAADQHAQAWSRAGSRLYILDHLAA